MVPANPSSANPRLSSHLSINNAFLGLKCSKILYNATLNFDMSVLYYFHSLAGDPRIPRTLSPPIWYPSTKHATDMIFDGVSKALQETMRSSGESPSSPGNPSMSYPWYPCPLRREPSRALSDYRMKCAARSRFLSSTRLRLSRCLLKPRRSTSIVHALCVASRSFSCRCSATIDGVSSRAYGCRTHTVSGIFSPKHSQTTIGSPGKPPAMLAPRSTASSTPPNQTPAPSLSTTIQHAPWAARLAACVHALRSPPHDVSVAAPVDARAPRNRPGRARHAARGDGAPAKCHLGKRLGDTG